MTTRRLLAASGALAALVSTAALDAQTATPERAAARAMAQQIPVGATVKVTTRDGRRFKAVLFAVNDDGVIVKPATRLPVASEQIPFDRLDTIQREEGRLRIGRYVGTGAAIAGGVMLWLLLGFAGG